MSTSYHVNFVYGNPGDPDGGRCLGTALTMREALNLARCYTPEVLAERWPGEHGVVCVYDDAGVLLSQVRPWGQWERERVVAEVGR